MPSISNKAALLLLPFLALPAAGQAIIGESHPEKLNDGPIQTDHYVKPSHDAAQATAAPAYENSFPATESSPPAEPELHTHTMAVTPATEPAVVAPVNTLQSAPVQTASAAEPNTDGDIVLSVPTVPFQVARGALLHMRLREALDTRSTADGSTFTAELLDNVGQPGAVLLPAGSLVRGRVLAVHGGRRISGRASMRLQPETISLPDGTLYHISAQLTDLNSMQNVRVTSEGAVVLRTHPKETAAVLGGVTGTAALTGALVGGGVGAAVGAVAGAGVATVIWLKRDVQENLPAGTDLIFAMEEPLNTTPRT